MNKIFEKYDDQHVMGVYLYKKAGDAYAYSDAAKTKKVDCDTLKALFVRGIFVVDGANTYKAVAINVADDVATITYVTANTTTATTAVLATLASEEYTAG